MNEFNPTLREAQAREQNPTLNKAFQRKEVEKSTYLEPVIDYFAALEQEILEMPIAQRYSTTHGPNFDAIGGIGQVLPLYRNLTEAEYRRVDLLNQLNHARSRAMIVIGALEDLVMSIEATKKD